jgi:excinuclease ABC subunit A
MQFLADIFVQCEDCGGSRYKPEALIYAYREKTIADVLRMTAHEASEFFFNTQTVQRRLAPMHDVGLEYLRLGQPLNTLSAGEAQRLKIASELSASGAGRTLYLFDEPTMGLHPGEVDKLLSCFDRLTKKGHTIVIIEHNLDVIASADHVIDLGPEGGDKGGKVIFSGAPAQLMKSKISFTGKFLKEYLAEAKSRKK